MNQIKIFDTTLRDGEQSPGCSMNLREKLKIARSLERLKVDVIEAGFAAASPGDFEAVQSIARTVKDCTVTTLARATFQDIDRAWEALREAADPRLHTFIATSALHMEHKLRMTPEQVLDRTAQMVAYARKYVSNIEFSCEDATRSDLDFLIRVVDTAIRNGATVINIPDTTGYITPDEMRRLIENIRAGVPDSDKVEFSVHCHNDLGMATANTLSGVINGARQVEVTINGIGERAGNTSLEEIVMITKCHPMLNIETNINTQKIYPTSRMISSLMNMPVQPNKAIVGRNAFAHSSGIHQDGVLKDVSTYEIMNPKDVGIDDNSIVLTARSGRAALKHRLSVLGIEAVDLCVDSTNEKALRLYRNAGFEVVHQLCFYSGQLRL